MSDVEEWMDGQRVVDDLRSAAALLEEHGELAQMLVGAPGVPVRVLTACWAGDFDRLTALFGPTVVERIAPGDDPPGWVSRAWRAPHGQLEIEILCDATALAEIRANTERRDA